MNVTGKWVNSYQSLMDITQHADASITGIYRSTTGSDGRFSMLGFANPEGPTPDKGQSVALAINWRSLDGGQGDASWHWTSGYSGQLSQDPDGKRTIHIMHAMDATKEFPGLADVGVHMDKLRFEPYTGDDKSTSLPLHEAAEESLNAEAEQEDQKQIVGRWHSREQPRNILDLRYLASAPGGIHGTLRTGGEILPVAGFTDIYARRVGLPLQSVTVASGVNRKGHVSTLTGNIDLRSGTLKLFELDSRGTPPDAIYTQTIIKSWTFDKQ